MPETNAEAADDVTDVPPPALGANPFYCRGCGYALVGLPAGGCPECGRPFDPGLPSTTTVEPGGRERQLLARSAIANGFVLIGTLIVLAIFTDKLLLDPVPFLTIWLGFRLLAKNKGKAAALVVCCVAQLLAAADSLVTTPAVLSPSAWAVPRLQTPAWFWVLAIAWATVNLVLWRRWRRATWSRP